MKKILMLIVLISIAYAQPTKVWEKTYGESNAEIDDSGVAVAYDDEENIYMLMKSPHTLIKYTKDGNQVWAKEFNTGYDEYAYDIYYDNNYLYVCGCTQDTTTHICNLRVVKYNKNGDIEWKKSYDFGYDLDESGYGIYVKNGDVYVTGELYVSEDDKRLFLSKIDVSSEDTLWTTFFHPANSKTEGSDVVVDDSNNIFVTGNYSDASGPEILLLRFNSSGDRNWMEYDNSGNFGNGITLLNGNIFVSGWGGTGCVVVKYDKDGNRKGDKTLDSDIYLKRINAENGFLYSVGDKYNGADFDIYLAKLNENLDVVWEKVYDSGREDRGYDIAIKGENIYVSGERNIANECKPLLIKYREESSKSITVLQPNGGENLKIGSVYTIKWNYTGQIDSVVIEYVNEGTDWDIDTVAIVENTGSYDWTVPDTPGDSTVLFISDKVDYDNIWDGSDDYFKISKEGGIAEEHNSEFTLKYRMDEKVISYSTGNINNAELYIYRIDGSPVMRVPLHSRQGSVRVKESLPSGVYFIVLKTERKIMEEKITIIK